MPIFLMSGKWALFIANYNPLVIDYFVTMVLSYL